MFGIEKDFQNLMEQVYGPLGEKNQMTEIEEVKAQIKVLEKKLSFLEELSQTKSPVEEAFKRVYGRYPVTDIADTCWDGSTWTNFEQGYNAAYEEKVAQEPKEPQTLYDALELPNCAYGYYFSEEQKDWICNIVKEWMSQYTHNVMTGEYLKGYEECLTVLEENLK
jgi:hypothetical protein